MFSSAFFPIRASVPIPKVARARDQDRLQRIGNDALRGLDRLLAPLDEGERVAEHDLIVGRQQRVDDGDPRAGNRAAPRSPAQSSPASSPFPLGLATTR